VRKFFLIGIPNCGKSTLGKRAADTLGLPFYDTDIMALQRTEPSRLSDIFNPGYQQRILYAQRDVVEELAALDALAIIATGAEVPLIDGCADTMREAGTIIHIQKSPEVILKEMKRDGANGFVLQNQRTGKRIVMREKTVELYSEELRKYEALADVTLINNESEEIGTQKLVSILNSLIN
jgi:shikimate kinase